MSESLAVAAAVKAVGGGKRRSSRSRFSIVAASAAGSMCSCPVWSVGSLCFACSSAMAGILAPRGCPDEEDAVTGGHRSRAKVAPHLARRDRQGACDQRRDWGQPSPRGSCIGDGGEQPGGMPGPACPRPSLELCRAELSL